MKITDLIERLEEIAETDPDAEVLLVQQQNWPFEHSITGLCQRRDMTPEDEEPCEECDGLEPRCTECGAGMDAEEKPGADGERGSDVFLVEGRQLRYGSKDAWDAAR